MFEPRSPLNLGMLQALINHLRHCFKSMMTALVLASNPLTANLERNLAAVLASTFPRITNKKLKKFS